ncbi:carbon-nitrogen hydrolase family protein [Mesorhizobium sp.]|uniref:carbon-nitrogen hydrolase family protein n=1 Tax=Mesorhizobium sp. TaxID=1871066 RepID=UPI000FE67AB1|nr:carbon-nitrogen hydrolase family protein [Mesorhizobium sp.]RWI88883.1 MAG: carbon-nitrogen hydrolase family protein [Mesorhizobium sp.]
MTRIALVQKCPPIARPAILSDVIRCIGEAATAGASLVAFPELYFPGFHAIINRVEGEPLPREFLDAAEPIPGPLTKAVSEAARDRRIHVIFTMLEKGSSGFHNAAVLIDPDGSIRHVHRKTMLTPRIDDGVLPGNNYEVVDTAIGRIGILICADATCPEPARIMALRGADLVVVCSGDFRSGWTVEGHDLVERIWDCCSASPARAVDNCIFWAAVNGAGFQDATEFFGGSRIIAPDGNILAHGSFGGEFEGLVLADLDLTLRTRVNRTFSLMSRRRPDLYAPLVSNPS